MATGLSGLYSWLPAKLEVYSEGWHCLEEADWMKVPALVQFLNSLHFCSTVCKVRPMSEMRIPKGEKMKVKKLKLGLLVAL